MVVYNHCQLMVPNLLWLRTLIEHYRHQLVLPLLWGRLDRALDVIGGVCRIGSGSPMSVL
jgi:hypothetical protein